MTSKAATEFDRRVGGRISTYREIKNISRKALGVALGVTRQQIQKYEKGTDRLRASRLSEIAKCLDVPMATLLGEEADLGEGKNLLECLRLPGSAELLEAFVAIENVELRRDILALVCTVAVEGGRSKTVSA